MGDGDWNPNTQQPGHSPVLCCLPTGRHSSRAMADILGRVTVISFCLFPDKSCRNRPADLSHLERSPSYSDVDFLSAQATHRRSHETSDGRASPHVIELGPGTCSALLK